MLNGSLYQGSNGLVEGGHMVVVPHGALFFISVCVITDFISMDFSTVFFMFIKSSVIILTDFLFYRFLICLL